MRVGMSDLGRGSGVGTLLSGGATLRARSLWNPFMRLNRLPRIDTCCSPETGDASSLAERLQAAARIDGHGCGRISGRMQRYERRRCVTGRKSRGL